MVLVPQGRTDDGLSAGILRQVLLRWLDADMLHGVGGDLRADQLFQHIQRRPIGQGVEYCRSEPAWRIFADILERQGEIEVLCVLPTCLLIDLEDACVEVQVFVFRLDLPGFVEFGCECVQHAFVLFDDRV